MNRIKLLRTSRDMKQSELAKDLGIGASTLSYWERGDFQPDNDSLIKLADYFNVTIDYLLSRTDDPTPPSAARSAPPDPFEDLSEESRKELEKFAELLKIRDKAVENHELAEEIRPEHT